jgi:hypothetical protein
MPREEAGGRFGSSMVTRRIYAGFIRRNRFNQLVSMFAEPPPV